jgi:hypothetical protein
MSVRISARGVGAMFDSTVLAGDAIRVADTSCRHALDGQYPVAQLCAHGVMLPKEPELRRKPWLH